MSFSIRSTRCRILLVRCANTAILILAATGVFSQAAPFSEADIMKALRRGVSSSEIEEQVQQRGIAFAMSPTVEQELRSKGASESLLHLLHEQTTASNLPNTHAPTLDPPTATLRVSESITF